MLKCAGDVGVGAMTQSGRMIASFAVLVIAFATITAWAQPGEVHGRRTLCTGRAASSRCSADYVAAADFSTTATHVVQQNALYYRTMPGALQTAMPTAVDLLKINCPTYRAPRPVVRRNSISPHC
jgi:hypothetical protein